MADMNNTPETIIAEPSRSVERKNNIFVIINVLLSVLYVPMGSLFCILGIMLFTLGYPEEPFTAVCSFIATLLLALTPVFCVLAILLSVRSRRKGNFAASFLVQFLPFGTLGIALVTFFLSIM